MIVGGNRKVRGTGDSNYYHRHDCRVCGGKDLFLYLDLGRHPPSNSFLTPEELPYERRFPLRVYLCRGCGLSQLLDVVSASDIFNEYMYLSSSSKALRNHYQEMVDQVLSRFEISSGSLVVDIGCNDGISLKCYPKGTFRLLGVEPSSAGEYAKRAGFDVVSDFFDRELGRALAQKYGHAALVTATNVFAHVDDIRSFAEGVQRLLSPDGIFVIEFPYVRDMIEGRLFDTIYHEHLCYLGLTPVSHLLAQVGARAFRVERTPFGASGPALRLFVCREEARYPRDASIEKMLGEERAWGIAEAQSYSAFATAVSTLKTELRHMIEELRNAGHVVGAFTAPAKGNTLLNYLELMGESIVAVAENNELKIGKVTPGSHIRIISDEEFLKCGVSHALLLSWNYADFFLKNSEFVKRGGKFIIPLPEPRIIG